MSLVALAGGSGYVERLLKKIHVVTAVEILTRRRTTVNVDVLREVAAKNNITIPEHDIEGYLAVLQSAELTATTVEELPDYIDERLLPTPTVGGPRKYERPQENDMNAWSHRTDLIAANPSSTLLKGRKILVKDNMSLGGVPYTCGTFPQLITKSKEYPISPIDAVVVKRLLDNGVTISGTSTCENYSLTPMSYTSANGPVHNPWLRNYNAGGSSSGAACLLGLRLARSAGVPGLEGAGQDIDIALGGDQAGSIRCPAAYCGVYGLKPTHGLVPYTGIAGLLPMIDHAGPMAIKLDDIALLLQALAGYDGMDGRMTPETPLINNVPKYYEELQAFSKQGEKRKPLRVGIISESLTAPYTSPELASVVRDAAFKHFSAAGATVAEVSVPMHLLGPMIWTASCRNHLGLLAVGGRIPDILTHSLPQWTPRWPPDQEMFDLLTHHNPALIHIILGETMLGQKFGQGAQAKAHRHVFQLRKAYDDILKEYDVLATPTTPTVAPTHPDMRPVTEGGSSVMDKAKLALGAMNNSCQFNATGHPALSVPCGWATASDGKNKLPVGLQIIGKRWDDIGVLKAARVFEIGGGGLGPWPGKGQKAAGNLGKL